MTVELGEQKMTTNKLVKLKIRTIPFCIYAMDLLDNPDDSVGDEVYTAKSVKARERAIAERLKHIQSKTLIFGKQNESAYHLLNDLIKELAEEKKE